MFEHIIKHYPDFPKPGIDFIDVLPFLHSKEDFCRVAEEIGRRCSAPNVTAIEARGFLFAAPLLTVAPHVEALLPVRKKGKIPFAEGDLRSVSIQKEYAPDELFYRLSDLETLRPSADCISIALLDDLLATGGTAYALARALQSETVGGLPVRISEFIFLTELPALGGRALLEEIAPVHSLMSLEGVE